MSPDPIYENLYDRFYAMMHDMAVMEHLAFAYAYSGDPRYGQAAVDWALACCRVWRKEAEGEPDGGKAYAVTRLLKGLAVAYDLLYDRLSEAEREELRSTITSIGQTYYDGYFTTPRIAGPDFHTHHAIVEYASFGDCGTGSAGRASAGRAVAEGNGDEVPRPLAPQGRRGRRGAGRGRHVLGLHDAVPSGLHGCPAAGHRRGPFHTVRREDGRAVGPGRHRRAQGRAATTRTMKPSLLAALVRPDQLLLAGPAGLGPGVPKTALPTPGVVGPDRSAACNGPAM